MSSILGNIFKPLCIAGVFMIALNGYAGCPGTVQPAGCSNCPKGSYANSCTNCSYTRIVAEEVTNMLQCNCLSGGVTRKTTLNVHAGCTGNSNDIINNDGSLKCTKCKN